MLTSTRLFLLLTFLLLTTVSGRSASAQSSYIATTDGGTLDVQLEPEWDKDKAFFKVSFHDPEMGEIVRHIDFDFSIENGDGEVYRAGSRFLPLHASNGVMAIPHKFAENGSYVIQVSVLGVGFIPIESESARFPINVTPEFNAGFAVAPLVAGMMLAIWIKNPFAIQKW